MFINGIVASSESLSALLVPFQINHLAAGKNPVVVTPPVDMVAKEGQEPLHEGEEVPERQEPEPAWKEMVAKVAAAEEDRIHAAYRVEEQGRGDSRGGASRDNER